MRKIQKISIVGGTVGVLMAGGVAFAAWTSTGSGHNDVTAGGSSDLTVTVGTASGLFPTGHQSIDVTVANQNPYPVTLTGIKLHSITVDSAHAADGCSVDGIVGATDATTANDRLAKQGDLGDSVKKTFSVSMGADAANGCKGATFTVTYNASADSSN